MLRASQKLGSLLSPAGRRARLTILIYHRVLPQRDVLLPDVPDAETFAWQMQLIARMLRPLPLGEAVRRLQAGTLPDRAACVTFDDGYADNQEVALPILERAGVPAVFFVAAGHLDGGIMWNDKIIEAVRSASGARLDLRSVGLGEHDIQTLGARRMAASKLIRSLKHREICERTDLTNRMFEIVGVATPGHLMMTSDQVRALRRAGMEIGGHTLTHPILSRLPAAEARREILEGRSRLEDILGERIGLFAYPNGRPVEDYGPEHVVMVREAGFDCAVSTRWGAARVSSDLFELPRFTPWDRSPDRFALRLLLNYFRP